MADRAAGRMAGRCVFVPPMVASHLLALAGGRLLRLKLLLRLFLTLILPLDRLKLGDWRLLTVWGQCYIESCLKRLGGKVAMTPMIVLSL